MKHPGYRASKMMKRWALIILALVLPCTSIPVPGRADSAANTGIPSDEAQMILSAVSQYPLIAASGAGAWGGLLRVASNGSFKGYYYDEDADIMYEVSFSGYLAPDSMERWGDHVYGIRADSVSTLQIPGTSEERGDGLVIVYDDAPFSENDYLRLTMPGAPEESIPEAVRDEIEGFCYGENIDYSRFITLTRSDGWGFFVDIENPTDIGLGPIDMEQDVLKYGRADSALVYGAIPEPMTITINTPITKPMIYYVHSLDETGEWYYVSYKMGYTNGSENMYQDKYGYIKADKLHILTDAELNAHCLTLPEGTTAIESQALSALSSAYAICIPASVTSIDEAAFSGTAAIIYGASGSYAQTWAARHCYWFVIR